MLNCIDLSLFNESRSCCSFLQLCLFFKTILFQHIRSKVFKNGSLSLSSRQVSWDEFLSQIEHVRVIEWHVVSVASKYNKAVLIHNSSVSIACWWSSSLHAAISFILLKNAPSWLEVIRLLLICLPLFHLVIIQVKVAIVILNQECTLHWDRSWTVKVHLLVVVQVLSLDQHCQYIVVFGTDVQLGCSGSVFSFAFYRWLSSLKFGHGWRFSWRTVISTWWVVCVNTLCILLNF